MTDSDRRLSVPVFVGVFIAVISLVLTIAPTLVYDPAPAPDVFEAIERHVRFGFGIVVGMLVAVHPWRRPWSVVIAWVLFCLAAGYLVARFVGMGMQGWGDIKQWKLVGIEGAVGVAAALWIWFKRGAPNRGE